MVTFWPPRKQWHNPGIVAACFDWNGIYAYGIIYKDGTCSMCKCRNCLHLREWRKQKETLKWLQEA